LGGAAVGKKDFMRSLLEIYNTKTIKENYLKKSEKIDETIKITITFNNIEYEMIFFKDFNTGFTEKEHNKLTKADGFILMYDVTNKFSVVKLQIFIKRLESLNHKQHLKSTEVIKQSSLISNVKETSKIHENNLISSQIQFSRTSTQSFKMNTHNDSSNISYFNNDSIFDIETKIRTLPPTVLVGNKSDLSENREISVDDGLKYSDFLQIPFFETSSKTNSGIKQVVEELIKEIGNKKKIDKLSLGRRKKRSSTLDEKMVKQTEMEIQKKIRTSSGKEENNPKCKIN
jgi:hypothetical protein